MKQFLYLDTDIITSIIAQVEKGYIVNQTEETDTSTQRTDEESENKNVSAQVSAGFLKMFSAQASVDTEGGTTTAKVLGTSTRAIMEKTLHDAAFDVAYNYIHPKRTQLDDQTNDEEGNYLELSRVFNYVDFDYLERLLSKEGILELAKKKKAKEVEAAIRESAQGANREQTRKNSDGLRKRVNEAVKSVNQQYDEISNMIGVLRSIIPYNRMLISSDGYLIPLDDKYFRIDPANFGFKYGGEITCVGMVTNIIGKSTDPQDTNNIFATIQFKANETLRSILPTKEEDLCVLHPIAVYYGT